jgi:hypothetical protein
MSKTSILTQLDQLNAEIEDISVVMDKTEVFRSFNKWLQERHTEGHIVCDINYYDELLSIDVEGTIIKADSLLQIRYNDRKRVKRSAGTVEPARQGNTDSHNN